MIYFTGDIHAAIDNKRLNIIKNMSEEDVFLVAGDFGY